MTQEYKFGDAIPVQDGKRWSDDPKVYALIVENERLRESLKRQAAMSNTEKVARWMICRGYATGHGDMVEDLLVELEWQVAEREREACANYVAEQYGWDELDAVSLADELRARGKT